jgi:DNA-binding IclR family transcriptional regulator
MVFTLAGPECHTDLTALIRAEYLEMPGLRVTLPQAARLWKIDRDTCFEALASLVDTGFLYRSGDAYLRAGYGRFYV